MPPVWVYEVATFYNMYNLKPTTGKYKVTICTNLPCALSGAEEAAKHLIRRCGVEGFNETSADGPLHGQGSASAWAPAATRP
jgi:NADH-quinone oxidoreductase subunit E